MLGVGSFVYTLLIALLQFWCESAASPYQYPNEKSTERDLFAQIVLKKRHLIGAIHLYAVTFQLSSH